MEGLRLIPKKKCSPWIEAISGYSNELLQTGPYPSDYMMECSGEAFEPGLLSNPKLAYH